MKVSELRAVLADLQRMLEHLGVAKQATELQVAAEALSELDDLTLPELVKRVRETTGSKIVSKTPKLPKPVNGAAVEEMLTRLQTKSHVSEEFDKILAELKKDKRFGAAELSELSRRFGGSQPDKLTKASVTEFLRERRLEKKRQGGLGSTIDKMLGRKGG